MTTISTDWLVQQDGGKEFAEVYLEHFDAVSDRLEDELRSHEVFGPVIAARTPAARAEARAQSRQRVERAFAGYWDFYAAELRRDGLDYASQGIPFAEWHGLATAWTRSLIPVLVERYAAEPARLAAVLTVLHQFESRSMAILGDSYLLASKDLHDALRLRGAQLELENRRVQEASRLKSEFLANMSHELRTPLNSILGFSELLHNGDVGPLADQQKEFVGDIYTSGKHLLRLINDILDLSKVEAGKLEFHPEDAKLTVLTHEVSSVLRGVRIQNAVTLAVTIDPAIDAVTLDTGRLKQVLYNFLSNAIKFSPREGTVTITMRRETDTSFRLEVSDQGPGIAAKNVGRLFTEFEQLDLGRGKLHGGTGLGLALTRRLVEAQGGTVGLTSVEGEGSTFFAILPLASPIRTSLPQPRRLSGPHAEAHRILVVEDDPDDQERLVSLLLGAGYAVDTAATGAQALRAIDERVYHAITLDLVLPDSSGLAVLQAIRKNPRHANVPVIVISVSADQVTAAFAVQEVLQKPLESDDLMACLDRLARRHLGPGPILVVDDDDASTRLMATSLTQLGFQVVTAKDGLEGLARAAEDRPCAVILDLVMPNLDGFGFLREFRAQPGCLEIPVLVWTTQDLTHEELDHLMKSATGVLPKDGSGARALLHAIRTQLPLSRAPSKPPSTI